MVDQSGLRAIYENRKEIQKMIKIRKIMQAELNRPEHEDLVYMEKDILKSLSGFDLDDIDINDTDFMKKLMRRAMNCVGKKNPKKCLKPIIKNILKESEPDVAPIDDRTDIPINEESDEN